MSESSNALIVDDQGNQWPSWELSPPPEGSPGVGQWVHTKYQAMRRHRDRQGLVELWSHNHELYRGRIFKGRSKYSQTIANLFFKVINALKANLTDNKPKASIMPRGDTPDDLASAWQSMYDEWWDFTRQQYCLQESVGKSELYGYQVDQMGFNPDLEGGLGEVETKRCNTYSFLSWPGHMEIQTCPMVCTIEAMELGEIYRLWPEARGKVKADAEFSEMLPGENNRWTRANQSKKLRPMGSPTNFAIPEGYESSQADSNFGGLQRALVIKMWCRDESTMWIDPETWERVSGKKPFMKPMIDPNTGQMIVQPEEVKKYPGGIRFIAVANKGNVVLEDKENPSINPNMPREMASQCYLWDKFPFIKRYSYSDDVSEYGLSIIEQIETLVVEICKKLTKYGVYLDTQCISPLILPQNCGVKRDHVNNLPSRIWEPTVSMAAQIRFLQHPQAFGDTVGFIELCIKLVDLVTGVNDVSEGRRPTGITSGRAIDALQEKAQVIYREKIRHLDLYLEEQARMFISLGQNWYTEKRKLQIMAKGEKQTVEFRGPDLISDMAVHIESGSTLPNNRAVRQGMMIELAKNGKLTNKTLFKELEVPNADQELAALEAGPIGIAMQKLAKTGLFDEKMLQEAQQILSMDDATFKKTFKDQPNQLGVPIGRA